MAAAASDGKEASHAAAADEAEAAFAPPQGGAGSSDYFIMVPISGMTKVVSFNVGAKTDIMFSAQFVKDRPFAKQFKNFAQWCSLKDTNKQPPY